MPILMRAAIVAVYVAFLGAALPLAAAAIPTDLAAEFERIAATYPGDSATPSAPQPADGTGDDLASMTRGAARHGAENQLVAAVIGAIAAQPVLTGEIVEAAIRTMPHLEQGVVNNTLGAFPGFREIIVAAATRAKTPLAAETASAEATQAIRASPRQKEFAAASPARDDSNAVGEGPEQISDPLEGFNRAVFFLNDGLDTFLIRPIAYAFSIRVCARTWAFFSTCSQYCLNSG